jgi:hypothetical protein
VLGNQGDRKIGVFIMGMPRILHDIVVNIVRAQTDMELLGHSDSVSMSNSILRTSSADVVIVGLDDAGTLQECEALARALSGVQVIGITADGKRSVACEVMLSIAELGEISTEQLADVIRRSGGQRTTRSYAH